MIYKQKPKNFVPSYEVAGCFFEYNNEILLLKRHLNKSQGGRWGVPAGKIEPNETITDAMAREILEETGVRLTPNDLSFFKTIYVHHVADFLYHMFSYKASYKPEIKINDYEHAEYKWISIKDALKLDFIEDLDGCIELFYSPKKVDNV